MDFAPILVIVFLVNMAAVNGQFNTHFGANRTGIVQLFLWKYADISKECVEFLGPRGFAGVQVSPVSENILREEVYVYSWQQRYEPISYKMQTRSGNESELKEMIKTCHDAGVNVYVDIVINHMSAPENYDETEAVGSAGSKAHPLQLDYPEVPYTKDDFHKPCAITDYTDAHAVRNCMLVSRPDLDHSKQNVKVKLIEFMDKLVDLGVAGFSIDGAKHVWPIDCRDIYARVKNLSTELGFPNDSRPFFYQSVIDLGGEAISKTEYSGYGAVTEFLYGNILGAIFKGKAYLNTLINWGPSMGFLPHQDAIVFIDSHESQRGIIDGADLVLTHKTPKKYIMANAFMLAHPYGIKRIMSSFAFEHPDHGPPANKTDKSISAVEIEGDGSCTPASGWVCEHRWNSIANMVEFANMVEGEPIIHWQDNGPYQIAFCRGVKGFIAFNNHEQQEYSARVYACLPPGDYCDIISGRMADGSCSGIVIQVDAEGYVALDIPVDGEHGVVAIHAGSMLSK